MASASRKRQRTHAWLDLAEDPATLRAICDHVAEGGALPEWCRAQGVRFADVNAWLSADEGRRLLYDQAKKGRDEYLGEIVIRNLRQLADVDIAQAYDENGNVLPIADMPPELRRAIAGLEVFEEYQGRGENREYIGQTKKIKLVDPAKAVELLGKYRRMFVDKVEHSGSLTLEDLVGGSMASPASPATTGGKP